MKIILFNDNGQLRSGWRAATFLLSFVLLSFFFIFGAMGVLALLPMGSTAASYLPLIIPFGISSAIAIILGWLYGRLFETLPFQSLGISLRGRWLGHFAIGCVVGAVAFVSAVIVTVMSGGMSFAVNRESGTYAITTTLLVTLVIFFVGAVSEETLFRGYLFQTLAREQLVPVAIAVT
ncbi:MAG: CPBP family glutamic-type intramembrane protease, partial [Pyrinomonadaceae bacterium]